MFKKLVSISFIVFVLSPFLWKPNISFADESDDRAIDAAMEFAENKSRDVDQEINKLKILKDAMDLMISEWENNKSNIVNGIELTLVGALGTTAILEEQAEPHHRGGYRFDERGYSVRDY